MQGRSYIAPWGGGGAKNFFFSYNYTSNRYSPLKKLEPAPPIISKISS